MDSILFEGFNVKYLLRITSLAGALALAGLAGNAQAALITHPGLATTAGSCYLGCGNPRHDSSNILDGDWGQTGNTGLNSWNSGYWGGWVQVDFGASYVLDRIELYGWVNTYDPFTLLVSSNGSSWSTLLTGGYHYEPNLTYAGGSGTMGLGDDWGAVYDVALNTLASGQQARYLRYSVSSGSPHWGYLFELMVDGHTPLMIDTGGGGSHTSGGGASIPEPSSLTLLGIGVMGLLSRRRSVVSAG